LWWSRYSSHVISKKIEWKAVQSQKNKMGKSRKQRKVENKEENEMKGEFYQL